MARNLLKMTLLDAILILAIVLVLGDLADRAAYARLEHFVPSATYFPFVSTFTILGANIPLVSPPTLDWVQVLAAALVISNVYFVLTGLRPRRPPPIQEVGP
ncbi:MAG: hypothetical protein HY296_01595 [Thaumarchaeota archaeon]|nr:hypothetical protein [Nitrososphaerota archaeon]